MCWCVFVKNVRVYVSAWEWVEHVHIAGAVYVSGTSLLLVCFLCCLLGFQHAWHVCHTHDAAFHLTTTTMRCSSTRVTGRGSAFAALLIQSAHRSRSSASTSSFSSCSSALTWLRWAWPSRPSRSTCDFCVAWLSGLRWWCLNPTSLGRLCVRAEMRLMLFVPEFRVYRTALTC